MKDVIETANKIVEEKFKNFIIMFLTAWLLFIPTRRRVAGAISSATMLTRILTMVSIGGSSALDMVFQIVDDLTTAMGAIIYSLV